MEEELPVFDGKKVLKMDFQIKGSVDIVPPENEIVKQLCRLGEYYRMDVATTLAIIYITGSRISEVIGYKYSGIKKDELTITKKPFSFGDISYEQKNGIWWWSFPTRVLKNFKAEKDMSLEKREKLLRVDKKKLIKIPYQETHPLYPLLQMIEKYMNSVVTNEEEIDRFKNYPFWDKSKRVLQRITTKELGINIHLLRHWRAKHLVEDYGYTTPDLIHTIKWNSPKMAMMYAESRDSVVEEKQLKASKGDDY